MALYSIGYGNRAIGDFIDLLKHYGIHLLIDIRSIPYSRFQVNFRKQALERHLNDAGIGYLYLGESLGGKKIDPDLIVDGKVDLPRLLANEDFLSGLDQVEKAYLRGDILALMCAELRPEKCHRVWMLTPPLEGRGLEVLHIDERGALKTTGDVLGWFNG